MRKNSQRNKLRREILDHVYDEDWVDDYKYKEKFGIPKNRKLSRKEKKLLAFMVDGYNGALGETYNNKMLARLPHVQLKTNVKYGNTYIYEKDFEKALQKNIGKKKAKQTIKRSGNSALDAYIKVLTPEYVRMVEDFEKGKPIILPTKKRKAKR